MDVAHDPDWGREIEDGARLAAEDRFCEGEKVMDLSNGE
jgi:hypothetical protein